MEDLRQSASQSGAARDRRSARGGLAFHAPADALDRDYRWPDVVAGSECSSRAAVPSTTARDEILA